MTKTFFLILAILLIAMGILGLIPAVAFANEPLWYALTKLILGLLSLVILMSDNNKA